VQQLLALYDREIVTRRDVLDAGMTEWVYRAARERLTRYGELARSGASPAVDAGSTDVAVIVASAQVGAPMRTARVRRTAQRAGLRPKTLRRA
jgi:hypothetical protein